MFRVCIHRLKSTALSWRSFAALILGIAVIILCEMPLYEFAKKLGKPLGIMEGFIYFSCDEVMLTAVFAALIFMVSDVPVTGGGEIYTVLRMSRKKWIMGNVMYLAVVCIIYYLIIMISGMIFMADNAYIADFWSEPVYYLTKGMDFGDTSVYFPYVSLLGWSPLQCLMAGCFLCVGYAFLMSMALMLFNIILRRAVGYLPIILIHATGYTLSLAIFSQKTEKFSLFANSLLMKHSVAGNTQAGYLTLWQTFLVYAVLAVLLIALNLHAVKRYDFMTMTGEKV